MENGQRMDVLSRTDIENLALEGRDVTELMAALPGAVTTSNSLTNTSPTYGDLNVSVDQSAVGSGVYLSGSIYRGGTSIEVDGAQTIDIGDMASSLVIIDPEMTDASERAVLEHERRPGVRPGGCQHDQPVGQRELSRRSLLQRAQQRAQRERLAAKDKTPITPLGPQSYYYPGGSFGGPVPGTHKKLLFWGGYEKWLQNQGNANVLTSYIPSPEMMAGDFSTDNADNTAICPNGFILYRELRQSGRPVGGYGGGQWCNDLSTNCAGERKTQRRPCRPRLRPVHTLPERRARLQHG